MAAAREMAEHTIGHQQFEGTLSADHVTEWTLAMENWESDPSKPNPFEVVASGTKRHLQCRPIKH